MGVTQTASSQQLRTALLDGIDVADTTLADLCGRAAGLLRATGVALVLTTGDVSAVTAASDDRASHAADAQATLGEGPTVDAQTTHLPVATADVATDPRWPQLGAAARALRIGPVIAVPLLDETTQLGVLTAYLERSGELHAPAITEAVHLARVLTGIILSLPVDQPAGTGLAAAITTAAALQSRVHQAAGVISVDQGCSLDDALIRMRAHAFSHDLLLSEVATAILDGTSRLA